MVFFVYASKCDLESNTDFKDTLDICENELRSAIKSSAAGRHHRKKGGASPKNIPARRGRSQSPTSRSRSPSPRSPSAFSSTSDESKRISVKRDFDILDDPYVPPVSRASSVASSRRSWKKSSVSGRSEVGAKIQHKAATSYADLSVSERRLGNEAIKAICDRGKTHNRLLAKASASIDSKEPLTRKLNRAYEKRKKRDPMPDLDLPKHVKLHSSWQQLSELKNRKHWHELLLSRTQANVDMKLPKHVLVYQKRKKQELKNVLDFKHKEAFERKQ